MALAFTSTTFETARYTVMVWVLGNPDNSPYVLLASQLLIVLGGLLGVGASPFLARRMRSSRIVLLAFCALAAYACSVAAVVHLVGAVDEQFASWVIACLGGFFGFVSTFNGTVWLPLLNDWHGSPTQSSRARLQIDGATYQLGKIVGPLVSGAYCLFLASPLLIASVLDAVTYLILGIFASRCVTAGYGPSHVGAQATRPDGVHVPKAQFACHFANNQFRIWLCLLVITMSVDGVKLYLPRLIQIAGASGSMYGIVQTCLAASAIVAALLLSRIQARTLVMLVLGCSLLGLGMAIWSLAFAHTVFWIFGAILIGSGSSAIFPSVTSALLTAARDSTSRSAAAGAIVLTRQWGGALGGIVMIAILSVAPMASTALLIAAVVAGGSWLIVPRTVRF